MMFVKLGPLREPFKTFCFMIESLGVGQMGTNLSGCFLLIKGKEQGKRVINLKD